MAKWAYELSNLELIEELMKATAKAGVSGSGLVIDPSASSDRQLMFYLKGVLFARTEGDTPPFKREAVVRLKSDATNHPVSYNGSNVNKEECYTVSRIYYMKDGKWALEFQETDYGILYSAENFELVDEKDTVETS